MVHHFLTKQKETMRTFRHLKLCLPAMLGLLLMAAVPAVASKGEKEKKAAANKEKSTDSLVGMASWYGPRFHGKRTATGDKYDQNALTCASNRFPLGTWLKVTYLKSGKSVIVRVNDRMHPRMKRVVDLSKAAASEIGIMKVGVGKVLIEDLGRSLPVSLP